MEQIRLTPPGGEELGGQFFTSVAEHFVDDGGWSIVFDVELMSGSRRTAALYDESYKLLKEAYSLCTNASIQSCCTFIQKIFSNRLVSTLGALPTLVCKAAALCGGEAKTEVPLMA